MSNHTPGPWTVDNDGPFPVIRDKEGRAVVSCGTTENAALIAAAPDLYDVARTMLARLELDNPNDGLLHDVRAALAKAGAP